MNRFFLDLGTARVAWTILVILVGVGLTYAIRRVLLLAALSLFFAYLLFPLVRLAQRWLISSRPSAIGVVYLVVLAALSGVVLAVGPPLTIEVQALAQKLPEMSKRVQSRAMVGDLVQTHMGEIIAYAQQAASALLKWLASAWVIVLIPVFAFFILKDVERFTAAAISRLSHRGHRGMGWGIAEDLHLLLGQYMRAQLLLALITFIVWSAVFLTAGAPYALVLAAIGGALEFIPVIGPLTAGIVAVGVSLFSGYAHPWALLVFVLVWRGIQDYATSPLVMARGVEVHPALVIVGVLAGGEFAGVAGMFLSVPVIAAVRIIWRRLQAPTPEAVALDDRELDSRLR